MSKRPFLSITATAFNEELNLESYVEEVGSVLDRLQPHGESEIVIVDNGSTDKSLKILKGLQQKEPRLRVVSLSRNFGHQGGILAGISHSRGAAVVTMDADGQHPAEQIPAMVSEWKKGYLVVHTRKIQPQRNFWRRWADRIFYHTTSRLSGMPIAESDFRLMDRTVVDLLLALPEREKFLRGLVRWLGFPQTSLPVNIRERNAGVSKFRFKDLIDFAFHGMTSFSTQPLRLVFKAGLMTFVPSFAYLAYVTTVGVYSYFHRELDLLPPGWATITATVMFFGAIQMLSLGVLGEYLARLFVEAKGRPPFIVRSKTEPWAKPENLDEGVSVKDFQ